MKSYSIAVIGSGHSRGSNLAAIHRHIKEDQLPLSIDIAIFTRADTPALLVAKQLNIPTEIIPVKDMASFETRLSEICNTLTVQSIVLAGFLKQLSTQFIISIGIPVINIHPALLPRYGGMGMYGMAVHLAVWEAGDKVSGATVHLVDPQYDHGTTLVQETVDISECTSPQEIAETVLKIEHKLYAPTIYKYLSSQYP